MKLLFDHDRRDRRQREYTMQNSSDVGKLKDILRATVAENQKNMVIATKLEVSLFLPSASVTEPALTSHVAFSLCSVCIAEPPS